MGKQTRNRLVAAFVLILVPALVIALFGHSGAKKLPPGARLKLPTGPVTPVLSMAPSRGAIVAGDGSLWSWGFSLPGTPTLGLGNITNQPYLRRIGRDNDWLSVSFGSIHCLALKSDGTMWAWGINLYGEFGNGTNGRQAFTSPVAAAPGNDWQQVAAGGSHSLALKKDGTLWAWGYNASGQLGIGDTQLSSYHPLQVGSASNWARIWADGGHGAALQSNGSLWVWGNTDQSMANNPSVGRSNILSPIELSPGTKWNDVTLGSGVMLAVKSDGTLWAWGSSAGYYNGVANGASNGILTRVGTNSDWLTIRGSTEALNFLGTKKDGSLWLVEGWGPTRDGGFATLGFVRYSRIELRKEIISYGEGWGFGVVLAPGGEVWTWGQMPGQNTPAQPILQKIAGLVRKLGRDVHWGDPHPVVRNESWLLPNIDPDAPRPK